MVYNYYNIYICTQTFFDSHALNFREFTKIANFAKLKCKRKFSVLQYTHVIILFEYGIIQVKNKLLHNDRELTTNGSVL